MKGWAQRSDTDGEKQRINFKDIKEENQYGSMKDIALGLEMGKN